MTATLYRAPVTAPLRDWLRTHLTTSPAQQIYAGGLPSGTSGSSVALFRVGGITDGAIDRPLIQFDLRATTAPLAEALVADLLQLLESTDPGTALGSDLQFMGVASVAGPIWSPDLPGDTPRFVVTVELAVKALA